MKKLLVVLLVLGFVAPAMAAEWNWYGSARAYLGWTHSSSSNNYGNTPANTKWTNGLQNGHVLTGTSPGGFAIGARVQATDAITGFFEIGHTTTAAGVSEGAKFRHLVGTWNFGAGKLSVGHTNTLLDTVVAGVVSTDDDPWVYHGFFWEGRQDQITLEFGGFAISALRNTHSSKIKDGIEAAGKIAGDDPVYIKQVADAWAKNEHTKAVIPKLEATYTWKADAFSLKGGVGFQTFDARAYDNNGVKLWDDDVTSWMFLLNAAYRPGPWFVSLGGWYGINAAQYGMAAADITQTGLSFASGLPVDQDKFKDSEMYSIYLVGGFNFNEMIGLGAGVSYMASRFDHAGLDLKDDVWNWYFQVPLTLTKGVRIIPEVGGHYYGKDKIKIPAEGVDIRAKQGDWHYLSAKFQIDF